MSPARTPEQTMELLARESRWRRGPVPDALGGTTVPPGHRFVHEGKFLLRCESGYGYLYVPGEGVTIERPEGADPDEEGLWLTGTVYCAIACLNGLLPIHASAVVAGGAVHAFTGPSGAGKSTLVAALGTLGLPMFCDDTLVLDLADPARILCLPGHKRLKLTDHALALTGARAEAPVGADTGKHYAAPPGGDHARPLPLAQLVFLEDDDNPDGEPRWEPIAGAERFARLADDHYTQELYREAMRPTRVEQFALRARIAAQVAMARLVRPRNSDRFAASAALVADRLRNWE